MAKNKNPNRRPQAQRPLAGSRNPKMVQADLERRRSGAATPHKSKRDKINARRPKHMGRGWE
jgi:hypothetical protein